MLLKLRQPSDKVKIIEYINKLNDSKQYDVTVNIHRIKRTIPQNRLYWLWINVIAKETGDDANHLHDEFGDRFLWKVQYAVLGIKKEETISTTALNTIQFKTYLDQINVLAGEYGIVLPNPDDKYFDEMVDYYSNQF